MTFEKINKYLKDNLTFNSTDLFYAFCRANGFDDPESDATEEEYDGLEKDFCEKVTYQFLDRLVTNASQDVMERFNNAF